MSRLDANFNQRRGSFKFDVQLAMDLRGITGVFGVSGSGKTTLLRCIAGLDHVPGALQCDGDAWQDDARRCFVTAWRRGTAFVFQDARLFPHLNVKGNLLFNAARAPRRGARISWDRVVGALQLEALVDRPVLGLSGGERQRVAIGRALLSNPRLLLMDEPLASVDEKRKREILGLIRSVADEFAIPVLLVSHAMPELIQVADQLVVMDGGRVVAHGAINDVLANLHAFDYDEDFTGCVLASRVVGHDSAFGLTVVEFNGQQLSVPRRDVAVGSMLRVFILSRNVSIAVRPITAPFSVLNALEGRVRHIRPVEHGDSAVDLVVDVGVPLVATITRKSLDHMRLHEGQSVFAYIKAVSL